MKKRICFALIISILGLLVAVAPYTFAKVCDIGEKVMKCHWTARAELFVGLAVAALALLKLVSDNGQYQLALNAGIALNAVGVILFPTALIGVCGKATMHCHSVTQPTLIVLGILIILATLIQTVVLWKKR
jgi:hypothetical protein